MAPPVLATTKSDFLRERFAADPEHTLDQARSAWQEAGNTDVISSSLFYIIKRRSLASTGRRSRRTAQAAEALTDGARNPGRVPASPGRTVCDEVEDRIDDLIVLIKINGGQPAVEAALRAARRLLLQP